MGFEAIYLLKIKEINYEKDQSKKVRS